MNYPITIFYDTGSPPQIVGWTDNNGSHDAKDYLKGANKAGHTCRVAAMMPDKGINLFVSDKGYDKYCERNGDTAVEVYKSDVYVLSHADYLLSKMKKGG